jgi:hypothetical protein
MLTADIMGPRQQHTGVQLHIVGLANSGSTGVAMSVHGLPEGPEHLCSALSSTMAQPPEVHLGLTYVADIPVLSPPMLCCLTGQP